MEILWQIYEAEVIYKVHYDECSIKEACCDERYRYEHFIYKYKRLSREKYGELVKWCLITSH